MESGSRRVHCTVLQLRIYGFLFPVAGLIGQSGKWNVEALTQVDRGVVGCLVVGLCPEIEGIAGSAALEAEAEPDCLPE